MAAILCISRESGGTGIGASEGAGARMLRWACRARPCMSDSTSLRAERLVAASGALRFNLDDRAEMAAFAAWRLPAQRIVARSPRALEEALAVPGGERYGFAAMSLRGVRGARLRALGPGC